MQNLHVYTNNDLLIRLLYCPDMMADHSRNNAPQMIQFSYQMQILILRAAAPEEFQIKYLRISVIPGQNVKILCHYIGIGGKAEFGPRHGERPCM